MRVLVVDDQFPKDSKSQIEEEIGIEIVLAESYQEALERQGGDDLSEYAWIITDICLPAEPPPDNFSFDDLFSKIWHSATTSLEDAKEESVEIYRAWKELGYQLSPEKEANITTSYSFRRLANQRGLIIASIVNKQGIPFTVFTSDIGHASPALDLLIESGILLPEELREVENAWDKKELLISSSKKLALGYSLECKEDPQTWIHLLQNVK